MSETRPRGVQLEKRFEQAERIDKHGAQICRVIGAGESNGIATVDLEPVFMRNRTVPGRQFVPEPGPAIEGIPYCYPGGSFGLWVPPSTGMIGILVQTEHEVREWIAKKNQQFIGTRETRRNDRSSGFFIPCGGGNPGDDLVVYGPNGEEFKVGGGRIEMTAPGGVYANGKLLG